MGDELPLLSKPVNRKHELLGMNAGTASSRLVKDLLFSFVSEARIKCFHCGEEITRETFSIEHKTPWMSSETPLETFFDLNNISYSHLSCNVRAGSKPNQKYFSTEERRQADTARRRRWAERNKRISAAMMEN